MDVIDSPESQVVRAAERIVYREKWRLCEEWAAQRLAHTRSLKWTPLFPESDVIQVVAIDGVVVGQLRFGAGRWSALTVGDRVRVAESSSFRDAVLALACAAVPW